MEHHARRLGRLAGRVRNVETFDAERIEIVGRQIQGVDQGAGAGLLRAFFRQQAGQLDGGILLRHLQPQPALFTRVVHCVDAHPGLLRQQVEQLAAHGFAGN